MPAKCSSKSSSTDHTLPRKRGSRSKGPKHPGVILIKPRSTSRTGWRVRFRDPDLGRDVWETLDPSLTTAEARSQWCVRKSKALARRRLALEEGAPRETGTALEAALGVYFEEHPNLRPRTLDIYRRAADRLIRWCSEQRLTSADDLNGPRLLAFRAWLVKLPKRDAAKGRGRGATKAGDPREPGAVNIDLRAIRTILDYLRRRGLMPHITTDALADGLRRLPVDRELGKHFKPEQIRQLLEAAIAHDSATFVATRAEHAGKAPKGQSYRHKPIAPLVATALLTGMRPSEFVPLTWQQVHLDDREIHLAASGTKTRTARVIDLDVAPKLVELLRAIRPAKASGPVFGLSLDRVKAAHRRLVSSYGAPEDWSWTDLRRTAGTYMTCAPGIFGAASAYRSARQLGHSVAVAEKHYVGVLRGIPLEARTLETAMGIEDELRAIVAAAKARL